MSLDARWVEADGRQPLNFRPAPRSVAQRPAFRPQTDPSDRHHILAQQLISRHSPRATNPRASQDLFDRATDFRAARIGHHSRRRRLIAAFCTVRKAASARLANVPPGRGGQGGRICLLRGIPSSTGWTPSFCTRPNSGRRWLGLRPTKRNRRQVGADNLSASALGHASATRSSGLGSAPSTASSAQLGIHLLGGFFFSRMACVSRSYSASSACPW